MGLGPVPIVHHLDTLVIEMTAAPSKGLAGRVIGVLTAPRATYADVAARPRWLGVLLVVLAAVILPVMALLSTEIGRQAIVDRQVQVMQSFGRQVTDAQYAQLERMAPFARYLTGAGQAIALPVTALVVSGILFAVFTGGLGANATFKQVFAVVMHSGVVTAVQTLFSTPLNYARQSLSSPTSLAAVLPLFDDGSFGAALLGSIDLFLIWWIVNLAIGLGVLYKRRTQPIATTLLIVYGAVALAIATVRTLIGA